MSTVITNETAYLDPGSSYTDYIVGLNGTLFVLEGATLTDSIVNDIGEISVEYGAVGERLSATSSGTISIFGSVTDVSAENGGRFDVYLGGSLSSGSLQNSAFCQVISGFADGVTVGGNCWLMNTAGGTILNTTINSGGTATVQKATAAASETTIMSGGSMRVVEMGNVYNTTILDGGSMQVVSGTAISNTVVTGGSMLVDPSNTVTGTTILDGGSMQVLSDCTIQDTTVSDGQLTATATLATGTVIGSKGTAAFSSSTVFDLEIANGGSVTMDNISILTGTAVFAPGASITINGILEFDTAYMTMVNAQITGMSAVSGDTTYTLTATDIKAGSYKLATDAAGFTGGIEIGSETLTLIETEDGKRSDVVRIGDLFYQILLDNSNELILKVMTPEEGNLFFSGKFAGGNTSMIARSVFGCVDIFSSETGEVWGTMNMGYGGDFISVGDFNGDGFEDILRTNYSGQFFYDLSNGDGTFISQDLGFDAGTWDEMGTGDFSGNGIDDILLADPNAYADSDPDAGQLAYKEYNAGVSLFNVYRDGWEMIATGHFGSAASTAPDAPVDNKADMLWKNVFTGFDDNSYNGYCTWITDSPEGSYWRMIGAVRTDEWDYLGAGDFNGDGTCDFALINHAGIVAICGVQNGTIGYWGVLNAVNTAEWSLAGIGDFNGDGTDDIAWYCENNEALSGLTGYWQINDMQTTGWGTIGWLA